MIPFLAHPYLQSLQDWLLIAVAVAAYFHTSDFANDPEHRELDSSWKIITALLWPVCLIVFVVMVIVTLIGALFSKKPRPKSKKD